ncbi:MAG: hypothetical protein [Caudoviricetes sp.]|nr:MAG: hypothetical protein [Caudoviricetes sp.]
MTSKARANWHWLMYKYFGVKRKIPCGRTRKTKVLCCMLRPNAENSYIEITEKGEALKCEVCGGTHIVSSDPIDINNLWGF